MPGTYHIIHDHSQWGTRRVPNYGAGSGRRHKTRKEETVIATCGRTLVIGRDQCCNIGIATPEWNYDWCHDCVRAFPWEEDARKMWLKKGIETMDLSSRNE